MGYILCFVNGLPVRIDFVQFHCIKYLCIVNSRIKKMAKKSSFSGRLSLIIGLYFSLRRA